MLHNQENTTYNYNCGFQNAKFHRIYIIAQASMLKSPCKRKCAFSSRFLTLTRWWVKSVTVFVLWQIDWLYLSDKRAPTPRPKSPLFYKILPGIAGNQKGDTKETSVYSCSCKSHVSCYADTKNLPHSTSNWNSVWQFKLWFMLNVLRSKIGRE